VSTVVPTGDTTVIGVISSGIWHIPHLALFLPLPVHRVFWHLPHQLDRPVVVGWGRRPSFDQAAAYARRHACPVWTLEDGFLRSMGLGSQGYAPLSLVIDDLGIYFDAYQPSRLERLIEQGVDDTVRARACIQQIQHYQLSKYNHAPIKTIQTTAHQLNILVVDQTVGDQSVATGGATADSFVQMLQTAQHNHPDAMIWIKTHPEVSAKQKKGYLSDVMPSARVQLLTEAMNPIALLAHMDAVYVVSSHLGFEALMLNKPVYCFGVPWYAGWGLTQDQYAPLHLLQHRRHVSRTLTQLFTAAYIQYARYINPITAQACSIEEAMDWLIRSVYWNRQLQGDFYVLGFSRWKVKYLKKKLNLPAMHWRAVKRLPSKIPESAQVMVWGRYPIDPLLAQRHRIWRMEDGFIRSVGLGAKLIRPMSLMLDSQGIYYDPAQPSLLETWLNQAVLSQQQQQRARVLIQTIIDLAISKYNVGGAEAWPIIPTGQRCILVAGQVEDDASVRCGGGAIQTNLALLKAVRRRCPDAFIVYKPHPDVQADLRVGRLSPVQLEGLSDAVIERLDMPSCLANADEVHTLTSLTGFEALLRGIAVTCYGMPFYAGWGLTTDMLHCERRAQPISLETLVYGALIACPMYMIPSREGFATVEQVIQEIQLTKHPLQPNRWSVSGWLLAGIARIRAIFLM
jgi:capsular polysaccharide export protein